MTDSTHAVPLAFRSRPNADPLFLLVARAASAHPAGEWDRVVTRPLSVADIVSAVQALLPLPVELRRPLD